MKKLALLMALMMAVCCLWGCGEDESQKAQEALDAIFNNEDLGNLESGKNSNSGETADPTATTEAHEFVEKILEEPGCDTVGTRVLTCSDCGLEVEEEIPALGHDIAVAGCTAPGICTRCGETTQPRGHVDQDGFCGECGMDLSEASNIIPTVSYEPEPEETEETTEATEVALN